MCNLDRDLDWILTKTPKNHSATEPYIIFLLLCSQKRIKRGFFIVDIAAKENNLWKKGTTEIEKEKSYTA